MTLPLVFSLLGQSVFVTEPYLQPGNHPMPGAREHVTVVWHSSDEDADWAAEARQMNGSWRAAARLSTRRAAFRGARPYRIQEAELDGLTPGATFDYRIRRNGREVFGATGRARGERARFAVFGDTGKGTGGQRKLAESVWAADPDAVILTGDIVYERGRAGEYAENYFPIFNSARVPLLRSRLTLSVPGNHDLEESWNLGATPDGLAWFWLWSLPRNGPGGTRIPVHGPTPDRTAFEQASGDRFPGMANYSYTWGPVHWTMLDSGAHVDWTRADLRQWLVDDLESAAGRWRVVVFHHPAFHSSHKHAEQQRMRLLHPIFERHGVRLVLSGHVHNYQRTHAVRFRPALDGYGRDQRVPGVVTRDAGGVVHVVSGAGGAGLHDRGFTARPQQWQEFTAAFEARQHSYTWIEADPARLRVRQVGVDGRELDRFEVTRK